MLGRQAVMLGRHACFVVTMVDRFVVGPCPAVHLHPAIQDALTDAICSSEQFGKCCFVVGTTIRLISHGLRTRLDSGPLHGRDVRFIAWVGVVVET